MADQTEDQGAAALAADQARGHQGALAAAGPGLAPGDAAGADQLTLPIGGPTEKNAIPPVAVRSGRGRPAGSKNRATRAWAEFINQVYGSPLEALASIYAQDVRALAAHLKCSLLDAIKVQIRCAELCAPYVHAKQPIQIDGGAAFVPTSIMVTAAMEPELVEALRLQGVTDAQLAALGRGDFDAGQYSQADQGAIEHNPIPGNHRDSP